MKKMTVVPIIFVISAAALWLIFRPKAKPITYECAEIIRTDIFSTVTATGTLQPSELVEVSTQVSGKLDAVYADFNDRVKKGEILARLDRDVLQLQVDQTESALASAESELRFRSASFQRVKELYAKKMLSADEFENAQFQFERAKAARQSAQIENRRARKNLAYTEIKSPIDGIVLSRSVEAGQTVAASLNAPKLFSIAKSLQTMELIADVDEADIGQVKPGMPVSFTVDSWPDTAFTGTVGSLRMEPKTVSNVVTYSVVISADNSGMKLFPGMTATVEIRTGGVENAAALPTKALKFRPEERKGGKHSEKSRPESLRREHRSGKKEQRSGSVWVLENGKPAERTVELGFRSGSLAEIKSGLSEKDSVIISQSSESDGPAKKSKNPFMPSRPGGRPR